MTVCLPRLWAADPFVWTGAAGRDWHEPLNWNANDVPGDGAAVEIHAGADILLQTSSAALASLTMTGGMITFSNWTTRLDAATIAIEGGMLTLPPAFTNNAMSNRVWLVCTDFSLAAGAQIDGVGKGYQGGDVDSARHGHGPGGGPGGDQRQGASYGGRGNKTASIPYGSDGLPYGTADHPDGPGSGGGGYNYNDTEQGGNGGGAVLIEAGGHIQIDGAILVSGTSGGGNSGGGSGGGVLLNCRTLAGSGSVAANGANTGRPATSGNGGGGRIAVHYEAGAQALLAPPGISLLTKGGAAGTYPAQMGSLYLTDSGLLKPLIDNLSGYLYQGGTQEWTTASLTLANAMHLAFPPDLGVVVQQNLRITENSILSLGYDRDNGLTGRFDVGGDISIDNGRWHAYFDAGSPDSLAIGGRLVVTNVAAVHLHAGATNGVADGLYGGLLDLSGSNLLIPSNSVVYLHAHPIDGGGMAIRVHDLTVAAGGVIDAAGLGGRGGDPDSGRTGYGPGGGTETRGGGYGGRGGNAGGLPYGTVLGPMVAGSGGGGYPYGTTRAGAGGGLVVITASGAVVVDGMISASGVKGEPNTAGGSGGGVLITCRNFSGSGLILAHGGDSSRDIYGGGGGGRIAVWYGAPYTPDVEARRVLVSETPPPGFTGPAPAVAGGWGGGSAAEAGTVCFIRVLYPRGIQITIR